MWGHTNDKDVFVKNLNVNGDRITQGYDGNKKV